MSDNAPNLFDYATSELSQDAWLCWLLAHVGRADATGLREAAHDFVASAWNALRPTEPIVRDDIAGPVKVVRQWNRVDVLAELAVRGRPTVLLLEDKTTTTQHSEQLARYRAAVDR